MRRSLAIGVSTLGLTFAVWASAQDTGNVIFIHPDGTGLNHWTAARMYWEGPDGILEWDQLPEMAVYQGHLTDRLTSTSNGGATVHAFGYKVLGPGSFGKDGPAGDGVGRDILARSGYPGSIMREAAQAGHPVGIVNDGDLPEPGTGAFLAEVDNRGDANEIARQFLDGRPGFEGEPLPAVMLGGGERFFLPEGTPLCDPGAVAPNCHLHLDMVDGRGPARTDGRNLIQEAIGLGYEVIRTRAEFEALMADLAADPDLAPNVLGLFAADDIFNDNTEETLIDLGLIDPNVSADAKQTNLLLWGGMPDSFTYNPPTAAEMIDMALTILERRSREAGQPFMLLAETESTDNLPNYANGIGFLRAVQHADDMIGVARAFQADNPDTLIVTAADSDAGGVQVFSPPPTDSNGNVSVSSGNPTGLLDVVDFGFPLDGRYGRQTAPFTAAPDAFGNTHDFAIGYPGRDDVSGGIISRAQGLNAEMLRTEFAGRFDNTDVYRLMYVTLFGEMLEPSYGVTAPTRD